MADITDEQVERYARHILLPEIGGAGQAKLLDSKVLVVGAGGLGSPVILYLAAAGIGHIGIIDDDDVDLGNLQRQIVHTTDRIGVNKAESARQSALALNPGLSVSVHAERLTADNALDVIGGYDLVCDGSDNFATRFLINDTCYLSQTTLVSAAILRFDGQLATFRAHLGGDNPCYRCLYPAAPPEDLIPTCAEAGVLGALCGVLGSLQAAEAIKEITGAGQSMSGSLLIFDGLATEFRKVKIRPDPACALCGDAATITKIGS